MQKTKVLAVAVGFGRFTAQDLASTSGISEGAVQEVVTELLERGSIAPSGGRISKTTGRPAMVYAWSIEAREQVRAELSSDRPSKAPGGRTDASRPMVEDALSDVEEEPFSAALSLASFFVEALEAGVVGEDASRMRSRAAAELRALQRRVEDRSDEDVSAVAALSFRLEATQEEPRIEDLRNLLAVRQAELLRKVSGIHVTTPQTSADPDLMELGYGIVLDVSHAGNPAASAISNTLAELSRHCFVLNFHGQSRESAMTSVLQDLSVFLSTPLSIAAKVFIVVNHTEQSWRKAEKIVSWFDELPNLKRSVDLARVQGREATGGMAGPDAAMLVGSQNPTRSHDWLGKGLNKQRAIRLLASSRAATRPLSGTAAKLALNNPLLIHSDPTPPGAAGVKLRYFIQRETEDKAVIRGLVMGSFAISTNVTAAPMVHVDHNDPWLKGVSYEAQSARYPLNPTSDAVAGLLPSPVARGR